MQGFDKNSGEVKNPVEMKNWPYHKLMLDEGFTHRHMRRSAEASSPGSRVTAPCS